MKVGIVGVGNVGATAAFAIIMRGGAREIVLVDKNPALATAQAQDILHATPFAYATRIRAGEYADLADCGVVILAAGVGQRPGETRLQLLERNAAVFQTIIPAVLDVAPHTILLVATNPLDVMTDIAARISGLPPGRVIGSGTILDSARFRALLARHIGISPKSVHAYVLGEHGDSEVLWWSGATVANMPIADMARQQGRPLDSAIMDKIDEGVRRAAYAIIDGMGATWFGIGGGLARIVQAIAADEHVLLSVAAPTPHIEGVDHVTLSLPRVIGAQGVVSTLLPTLTEAESTALRHSAETIKSASDSVVL